MSEANRQRKWDREEVVILVTEYFRSKKWTNENIVENQKKISRFLKKREQMHSAESSGLRCVSERTLCKAQRTP